MALKASHAAARSAGIRALLQVHDHEGDADGCGIELGLPASTTFRVLLLQAPHETLHGRAGFRRQLRHPELHEACVRRKWEPRPCADRAQELLFQLLG